MQIACWATPGAGSWKPEQAARPPPTRATTHAAAENRMTFNHGLLALMVYLLARVS
jgi:hypothetical protein